MDERIRSYLEQLETSPGNAEAFSAAEALLTEGARWEELVKLYEGRLEKLPDLDDVPGLLAKTANVLHGKLSEPGRAEGYFQRVLDNEPNSVVALAGLRSIYESRGDTDELCGLLEREAARATSPEAAAGAYLALGKMLDEKRGRKDRALLMWQRALRLLPHHREALKLSREGYLALGRLEAAKGILDREVETDPGAGATQAALYAELGGKAAELPSRHPLARACGEAAVQLDATCAPAKRLLISLDAAQKGWKDQVRLLRSRAVEERDRKVAARQYLQIAELHAAFETDGLARIDENLERAFLLWPGMPEALDFLERFHGKLGDPKALVAAYEKVLAASQDRHSQVELHMRLAALQTIRFGDRVKSLQLLEKAAALDPSRSDATISLVEGLYDERRFEDAAAALERHLAVTAEKPHEIELRLRLSELYGQKLLELPKARAHLETILRLDPRSARADELLEPLLEAVGDKLSLAQLYERRVARTKDSKEKLRLLEKVAELLPDERQADRVRILGRALLLDPARQKTRKALELAAAEAGAPEELVRVYRAAADVAGDEKGKRALQRRIAELLSEELGRPADAAREWRRVLEVDPGDISAQRELEQALSRAGEYAALAEDHRAKLSRATDPAERKAILEKLAVHHEQTAKDPVGASDVYRELLGLAPGDPELLRKLAAVLAALERWPEQHDVLSQLARQPGPPGLAARGRLAALLAEKLGRPEEAARLYLTIVAEEPEAPGVVPALERLFAQGVEAGAIAELLQPRYAAAGEWPKLTALLEVRLSATREPAARLSLSLELSEACEKRLEDPRGAFTALARAFGEAPGAPELHRGLERLSAELGNTAELAALYRSAWGTRDAELARLLATKVAAVAEGPLAAPELAAQAHGRVLELDPADPRALASLAALAADAERWDEAASLTGRLLQVASPEQHAALERRRGELLARQGRPVEAARAFQAALAAGGPEGELLAPLSDALEAAAMRDELAEVLARRVALAQAAGDVDLVSRLSLKRARTLEGQGARSEAVERYAEILQGRPTDPEAMAALEKLLDDPELAAGAARALERSYEAGKEPRKLARAIELQATAGATPEERSKELRRLAKLLSRELRSPSEAFAALLRAFRETPADALLRSELRVAAAEADCLVELAGAMGDLADELQGTLPAPQLLAIERELAELHEKRLADRGAAVLRYERMRVIDPESLDALRALHRLRRAGEEWPELYTACVALAAVVYDDAEKLMLWREAGRIAEEQLADPARAAIAYRNVADADPEDGPAVATLDRLYAELGQFQEQAFAIEARRRQARTAAAPQAGAEGAETGAESDAGAAAAAAREQGFRLAELRRSRLGDPAGALSLLRELLAEEPKHAGSRAALDGWTRTTAEGAEEALSILDPILAAGAEHGRRIELREERLRVCTGEERARRYEEVREIYEVDLGQADGAFMTCCRAFVALVDPTGNERAAVRPHLERLARETGSFEELADVYEDGAGELSPASEQALSLRRRAAELREVELKDAVGAIRCWNAVLEAAPADRAALDALERLFKNQAQGSELTTVYRKNAQLAADPAEKLGWLMRIGTLAAESLADDGQALAAFREALGVDPTFVPALEAIDRLLVKDRLGNHPVIVDTLERLAALAPEGSEARARHLLRRAQQLEEHALAPDRGDDAARIAVELADAVAGYGDVLRATTGDVGAVTQLERLLLREDVRLPAARLLEPIYRARQEPGKLVGALDLLLGAAVSDRGAAGEGSGQRSRQELLREIAALREAISEKPGAFAATAALFRELPDDDLVREQLVRLARETGSQEELAGLLEDEIERRPQDDPRVLTLLRVLAPLYGGALARPQQAAAAHERIAARVPDDGETLEELARLYRRQNQVRELVSVYRRQAAQATEPGRRKDLYFEMANLMEEQLADRQGAIEAYRQILAVDEADPNALAMLSRLLGETSKWPELAELLVLQVDQAVARGLPDEARELRYKLARVRQVRLADAEGALVLFRGVLAEEARHSKTLAALEELQKSEDAKARALASEVLGPIYEEEQDWARFVQTLEARAVAATDAAVRAPLLRRVAEVFAGPLASPDMAFLAAGRALREAPDDAEIAELASSSAEAAGDLTEELAALLAEAAAAAKTEEGRLGLRRSVARILERSGEAARAKDEWKKVRSLSPDDAEALDALARINLASGDTDAYLEVLRAKLARSDEPGTRRDLLLAIAIAQEEKHADLGGAISSYRRLLELSPLDAEALLRMDQLCVKQERWTDLADVLARQERGAAARSDLRARVEALFRLAQLKESRLLDRDGAITLYRELLELAPDHGETVARLEAILVRDPQNAEAAELLEQVYLATQNWQKYAGALENRAGNSTDPQTRKQVFTAIAEVRERRQHQPDLAFIALTRAFREDPSDAELRASLERTAESAETFEELVALYEEELPRIRNNITGAEVALRIATIAEARLNEPAQALVWFEKARELDAEVGLRALPALDRLYRQAERFPELADVLELLSVRTEDPHEKVATLFRLGQLCEEKLQSKDRAALAYERMLELEPRHLPALRALEKLYDQAQRFDKLYENLATQREAATEGTARDRITAKLAEVAATGLRNKGRAIEHYQELLARNPRHDVAQIGLEGLYEDTARWQELSELLRARLQSTVDPREINRLNDRLGWVLGTKLGEADQALKSFQAVLERDPKNRKALEALRDIHVAQGEKEALAGVLRRLVPLQDDALGVKGARLQLAETLAELGRREEAIENAKRTLDLEPHDRGQLARAEALFLQLSAWSEAIRAKETRASLLDPEGESDEAIKLWGEVAGIWEEKLGRKEGAAAANEKILELRPSDREAFSRVREIYRQVADWRRYTLATERFVSQPLEAPEKLGLLKELAQVHEERLGQKEMAFTKLGAAFESEPSDESVRATLLRLADDCQMHEELSMIYDSVADSQVKGALAAALYLELGRLQDERLDDPTAAEETLRKVLEFEPTNQAALEALGNLFARRGQDKPYVLALEQKLEAVATLEEKKAILHEIARIYDERLSDVGEAIYSLRRALELDSGDNATITALSTIYRRERRFPDLASLLARARDVAVEPTERAALQLQLAELTETELADDEAAIAAYSQALEIDPGSGQALEALERLYTKLDRSAELLRVYDRKMDFTEDGRERSKILFKAAAIWEEKFENAPNAIACLEGVLAIDPENLAAVKGLEGLFRQENEWERLIRVSEQHIVLIEHDPGLTDDLVDLHVKIADVFYKELGRVDRAESYYVRALELEPDSRKSVNGLGRLYERTGNWPLALEMLRRETKLAGAARDAVELFYRQGKINEDMLLDPAAARTAYQRALDLDPSYLPAIRSLRAVHEAAQDWDGFLDALVQEANYTEDTQEKTRLFDEVGRFYLENREDKEGAARYFEEARRQTPDDLVASRALADLYIGTERWPAAEECLDVVCGKLLEQGGGEALRELTQKVYRLGFVAEKLQKHEKALQSYRKAYELDPTFLPAAEGLAHLLVVTGDFQEARNVYQAILIHHRDDLTDPEVVEIHWSIGDLRGRLGDADAALKSFRNALELDPYHAESHRSLFGLHEEAGRYDEALEHRQKLLDALDGDDKYTLLVSTAEVAREKLSDPYQAIDCYQSALKLKSNDVSVMEALLGLFRDTKQGPKAVELLERLLAVPALLADKERAIRYHVGLAETYRDEVRDDPDAAKKAAQHFNAALDLDWRQTGAFQSLEALLGKARDWHGLEQNYVKMLGRLPKEDSTKPVRVLLYRTLGDLYLKALKNPQAALDAYKAVAILAPDDPQASEAFAELLAQKPGGEAEAIEAWRKALKLSATPEKAAKALVLLHAKRKHYDKAYVTSEVVCHILGQGGNDEQGIIAKLQKFGKVSATKQMTDRMWTEHLYHERVRGAVGEILALLHEHAGALFAVDHGHLEIQGREVKVDRKKDRVDVSGSMLFFVNAYKYVARTFSMDALELFKVPGVTGLNIANTFPVCLVAGEDMFTDQRPKKELYFYIGKNLAFSRPELVMARLHRFETLDFLLQAAVSLGEPRAKTTLDPQELERIRKRLEKALSPAAAQALQKLAYQYTRDPTKPDLRSYIEGAELTATRAGVLLATDIQVAYKCVSADQGTAARLRPLAKQRDLLMFCMSEDYFGLRDALGIAVDVPR